MTDVPWIDWYQSLAKPLWTPAPRTIGLIWQILYPVIIARGQALKRRTGLAGEEDGLSSRRCYASTRPRGASTLPQIPNPHGFRDPQSWHGCSWR